MTLLEVRNLSVEFTTMDGPVRAVRDLSFELEHGKSLGIVGESGSGKTVSVLALMGLLSNNAEVVGGQILFDGEDVLRMSESRRRALRGSRISMIFQDPMTALNPVERVGTQIGRTIEYHDRAATRRSVRDRTIEALESVGVPDASRRSTQYPHQWSGGMRQRAVIAMALVNRPDLIVADEPTTALDATVQAQVLDVLRQVRAEQGCALIMISHDLEVVRDIADDVMVMYAGAKAEVLPAERVFDSAGHPYTRALVRARPGWGPPSERLFSIPGRPPDLLTVPPGCPFEPRCAESEGLPACRDLVPRLLTIGERHRSACHRAGQLSPIGVGASETLMEERL
ncbi:ABC transporter ATP-binding protein [Arthrobacter sp. KBS0702]|uniref:ABC transporter ATP-binding protein n=1 Tax=Arthrobacter sp. KBS0702 TaxID=2578107 RepID=UPI00110DED46|nr:ABC transporter ATP-binding protein [Arthrobacter sp. KBS0702]QDW30631.1 ABC transporter ATP-binding protein [Arthrobacter sp. KBS0702]